jgi:uncharacterized membrane protein
MRRIVRSFLVLAPLIVACSAEGPTVPRRAGGDRLLDRGDAPGRVLRYTSIDVPGARLTSASGINARGDIVGTYADGGGSHGFLLRDGEFTTIDFPGAAGTEARGIGPSGEIVGDYWLAREPAVAFHGYLRTKDGEFVPVRAPGHLNEILQRILPDGTILGCRHDNDLMASMRGIAITGDGVTEIEQFASMHNGSTPDGRRVVGLWTNMMAGRREGYVIDDGVFRSFVVPGSSSTSAWDVNPAGDIVGVYRTGAGTPAAPFVLHGFVRHDRGSSESDVTYSSVEVPGASSTQALGINARGDIVGSYVLGGKTHGFVARWERADPR